MIRLILIDIDGTLVGRDGSIHPTSWEAMAQTKSSNIQLAICTGRPCLGQAQQYAQQISPNTAHIFQSGAVVCTPDGMVLHHVPFPEKSYAPLIQLSRQHQHGLEVYTTTECFVDQHTHWTKAHAQDINIDVKERDLLSLNPKDIVRVQWVVPWSNWSFLETETAKDPALEISVAKHSSITEVCFSSVTAKGISKASAAAMLAQHHGFAMTEVCMVGDGDNDLEVMKVVGLGIAMGNATPKLKAVAHQTVSSVDEGGLAQAIWLALNHP